MASEYRSRVITRRYTTSLSKHGKSTNWTSPDRVWFELSRSVIFDQTGGPCRSSRNWTGSQLHRLGIVQLGGEGYKLFCSFVRIVESIRNSWIGFYLHAERPYDVHVDFIVRAEKRSKTIDYENPVGTITKSTLLNGPVRTFKRTCWQVNSKSLRRKSLLKMISTTIWRSSTDSPLLRVRQQEIPKVRDIHENLAFAVCDRHVYVVGRTT